MLKRLRRRFILITMGLLTLVLIALFAINVISTWQSRQAQVTSALAQALDTGAGGSFHPWVGGSEPWPNPLGSMGEFLDDLANPNDRGFGGQGGGGGAGGGQGGAGDRSNFTPVYIVLLNANGMVIADNSNFVSMDSELAAAAITRCNTLSADSGLLGDLGLFYQRVSSGSQTLLAFADADPAITGTLNTAAVMGAICLGALLAFFGISVLLARVATRPIARTWEQQRRFVADASHELRTPLTVILANSEVLLSDREKTVGEQSRWIDSSKTEARRMQGLVNDLLDLARADAEADATDNTLSYTPVDFSALTNKVLLQFEAVFFERHLELTAEVADDLTIQGDAEQLERLVAILLDNASKYAATRARLHLSTDAFPHSGAGKSPAVRLSLNNDGAAIPPEALPHVLERFYRGEASHGGSVDGYGLGLALATSIVERHHGSIGITSDDASGTTVSVEFPARLRP